MLSLIACMAKNRVIGHKGHIPWKLKGELEYFRTITAGSKVIMGRKTWESLPVKPLKSRLNVVVSRNTQWRWDMQDQYSWYDAPNNRNAKFCEDLQHAILDCSPDYSGWDDNIFIIGGASLYEEALKKLVVDRIYLTVINQNYEGDVFFPQFNQEDYLPKLWQTEVENGIEYTKFIFENKVWSYEAVHS